MKTSSYALGRTASFWVSAAVVAHTLWTSAAPAMTYPLYAAEWGLTPTVTTAIFAIYPIVVVMVLIGFGDISDYIGRRATMLFGLAASLIGVFLFAVAPSIFWVFVGRAFMGLGVGLSASPSAAAMVEFSAPGQSQRASAITTAAQALGLMCAALIGGGLIEYAPFPTRLNFWALLFVLAAVFAATWFLPRHTSAEARGRWRLKAIVVPKGIRDIFASATIAVTASYALGAVVLSLGAQIARDLIGSSNSLVNGATIALFAVVAGAVTIPARHLASTTAIVVGGMASAVAIVLLAVSASEHALLVFIAAAATAGAGYSMLFSGGLNLLSVNAPPHHRGGTLSALFLVAYLTQGVVALGLGTIATAYGLAFSIDIGAIFIATLSIAAILLALHVGKSLPSVQSSLGKSS
jgi:predicted MFS family arabinose efflux permease